MMHLSLIILIVACVCYSTVEARPGSRSRSQDVADESDVDVRQEIYRCYNIAYKACIIPMIAEVFPEGPPSGTAGLNAIKELGVKNLCSYAIRLEQCATTTLNTRCSAIARQTILMLPDGRQIRAARNALQYICVQHIADFEELETCVKQTEQQGVNFFAEIRNATHCSGDGTVLNGPRDCDELVGLGCSFDVLKSYCRETGTNALDGLMSGLRRDLGCRVIDCRNDGPMESFRRAFN